VNETKEKYVEAHPEARDKIFKPRQPRRDGENEAEGSGSAQSHLYGEDGKLRDPTRSVYYDPVYNPFGVPPPGMPYKERSKLPHPITAGRADGQHPKKAATRRTATMRSSCQKDRRPGKDRTRTTQTIYPCLKVRLQEPASPLLRHCRPVRRSCRVHRYRHPASSVSQHLGDGATRLPTRRNHSLSLHLVSARRVRHHSTTSRRDHLHLSRIHCTMHRRKLTRGIECNTRCQLVRHRPVPRRPRQR